MSDQIIPSVSIEAIIAKRDAAIKCLERIQQAAADYVDIFRSLPSLDGGSHYDHAGGKWDQPLSPDRRYQRSLQSEEWLPWSKSTVDASLWEWLMSLSGMRTFLDAKARQDWDKGIEENKTPELTEPNIRSTFSALHNQRGEFFERGVVSLFRSLSWDYKSNKPQKFGKRLVLRYMRDRVCSLPNYRTCDTIDDLMRAFHILDRKPETDHRQGVYRLLAEAWREGRDFENDYIRIRTFKNGNAHVYLLRQDLVQQMNLILHKHLPDALPAEAA